MIFSSRLSLVAAVLCCSLSACGGGSSSSGATPPVTTPPVVTPPVVVDPPVVTPPGATDPDWLVYADHCATPRTGLQPNGLPYYDFQGTLGDELKWVRSFMDESYLWYKELPALNMADYRKPVDYFTALKTPLITASGKPKDQYHFTYQSEVWDTLSATGAMLGYGITWSRSTDTSKPRVWSATLVEPGSSAASAGVQRGDVVQSVDGVDIHDTTTQGQALLSAALTPSRSGETHTFVMAREAMSTATPPVTLTVTLTSTIQVKTPVQNVKVLPTPTGAVGYLQFHDHNAVAEGQLVKAFTTLKEAAVTDLVLDMRYNGGGYLTIASELAYMIAGPDATTGKTFEKLVGNGKLKEDPPLAFLSTAYGFVPAALKRGAVLPYLGLKRVTVLTTAGTCSASESLINGLRGADIEVNLIGGQTCGKPYAFVPAPNCGTTYFAIQIQGFNHKGFGDYADGFSPACAAGDDLQHALGDPQEGLLATALSYRTDGVCPARPSANRSLRSAGPTELVRPAVKEIAIYQR